MARTRADTAVADDMVGDFGVQTHEKRVISGERLELSFEGVEILDGADLAYMRSSEKLARDAAHQALEIELLMSTVKFCPSGFFGALGDWHDKGHQVVLVAPTIAVRNYLWFQLSFELFDAELEMYRFRGEPLSEASRNHAGALELYTSA